MFLLETSSKLTSEEKSNLPLNKKTGKGNKAWLHKSQNPSDKEKIRKIYQRKHIQLYKGHIVLCKRRIRASTTPVNLIFLSSLVKRVVLLLMGTELPFSHYFFFSVTYLVAYDRQRAGLPRLNSSPDQRTTGKRQHKTQFKARPILKNKTHASGIHLLNVEVTKF